MPFLEDIVNIFLCFVGDYNTTRIGNLQRHIRAKHDGQRNFKCHLCGKAFAEKQTLQKHMQKVCQKEGSSTTSQNNHEDGNIILDSSTEAEQDRK